MSEEDRTDIFHPDVIEAFAEAWASIDGKLDKFIAERDAPKDAPKDVPQDSLDGHYDGYMYEAAELLTRASKRIKAFDLFWRLDPSP